MEQPKTEQAGNEAAGRLFFYRFDWGLSSGVFKRSTV
jgi:hypothetical protein